jgi:hypothetical protein
MSGAASGCRSSLVTSGIDGDRTAAGMRDGTMPGVSSRTLSRSWGTGAGNLDLTGENLENPVGDISSQADRSAGNGEEEPGPSQAGPILIGD